MRPRSAEDRRYQCDFGLAPRTLSSIASTAPREAHHKTRSGALQRGSHAGPCPDSASRGRGGGRPGRKAFDGQSVRGVSSGRGAAHCRTARTSPDAHPRRPVGQCANGPGAAPQPAPGDGDLAVHHCRGPDLTSQALSHLDGRQITETSSALLAWRAPRRRSLRVSVRAPPLPDRYGSAAAGQETPPRTA
jgi:hypothetical protein